MPKINIYNTDMPVDGPAQRFRLELGWSRGQTVQLGVTRLANGADPLEEYFTPEQTSTRTSAAGIVVASSNVALNPISPTVAKWFWQPTPGQPNATMTGPEGTVPLEPTWQGWHMPLDRAHINQLIIELRRARDVAYGRDA